MATNYEFPAPRAFGRGLLLVAALFVVFLLTVNSVACVNTGHVGIVTMFGRTTGTVLGEGIHLINPMANVTRLTARTQELKEAASVPSQEGLLMHLETSVIYHLDRARAAELYRDIGAEYADVLLVPNLRSAMRAATSGNPAEALYSEQARDQVANDIERRVKAAVEARGIVIEDVLLRDVQLPEKLKASIEAKQQMDQEAQRMVYVLQKEKQEAERKGVEAQGVKDFQDIVAQGISDRLLQWKGIEATIKLAESPNSKVVIIGDPKHGLPLIFPTQ